MKIRVVLHEQSRTIPLRAGSKLILGRQNDVEMKSRVGPLSETVSDTAHPHRVIVAWGAEFEEYSQDHIGLDPLATNRVLVKNLSARFRITVGTQRLLPGESAEFDAPFAIKLPRRTFFVEVDASPLLDEHDFSVFGSLPPNLPLNPANLGLLPIPQMRFQDSDRLAQWLQTTLGVLQAAIGSADFLRRAAEALVSIVGLSSGCVLLRTNSEWDKTPIAYYPKGIPLPIPSTTALRTVLEKKKIYWPSEKEGEVGGSHAISQSLALKGSVVAVPLVDGDENVIGALYGECRIGTEPDEVRRTLVSLLSSGVSAGIARQKKEQEAAQEAARFEAFFSKSLAAKLRIQPDMLKGKKTTVTILFCDIRGYSGFSAQLDPEATERWIHDVLGELSKCILDEDGVVVDYIGDGVMAMWGAPEVQADQTDRALRAGLAMVKTLTELNGRWRETLGADMSLGVGIHRGEAQVGNCGTESKFKYGAIGDTVNRASRVEGMTKHLKCRVLLTGVAHAALLSKFRTRRVVLTRLTGIDEPVCLYEAASASTGRAEMFPKSEEALDTLEQALDRLERDKQFDGAAFSSAARQAGTLLGTNSGDGPLLLTLSRATEALIRDGQGCSRVWTPPGK